uniref:Release factor glutamine methyltransferase n=1 Tax=Candidatus Kentrum sp. UNK TaxID=2126344 RepID=A0A451ALG4_9GAMM|nr:MAG: [protein release factor]-glutamine N5-methyltransferase [Candidatus Kentron sp. UNK]VFK72306.1 MAG: [protein release factor]-glutamine N5-methyltransferase [Candidatus Kentron sp. UNK]
MVRPSAPSEQEPQNYPLETATLPTLRPALEQAVRLLESCSTSARADAEILLGHVLEKPRYWPYAWQENPLPAPARERFRHLIERRRRGVPVAYLMGRRGFWSLDLSVTRDTLIPRPETECLVEAALDIIPKEAKWSIADLGTGAGPIALALAHERPGCSITATDISAAALDVAKENARAYKNLVLRQGNWFDPLHRTDYHMIVSNPPYVAANDPHLARGDVRFEPSLALLGGPDGLDAIRHIARKAREHLMPGGWLILEHGFDQGARVRSLLRSFYYGGVMTRRDYGERERITMACRAETCSHKGS